MERKRCREWNVRCHKCYWPPVSYIRALHKPVHRTSRRKLSIHVRVQLNFSSLLIESNCPYSHILLGSKGIELPKISQKLESLSARKTFEPLDPIADTDIQGFLRNEKENAILSVIEEVHKNSYQSAQNQKWEHIISDWKQEKVKLMNALIGPSQNWIDIRKGPEQTILNEVTFGGKSSLNSQEMAYAREVYEYNKLVIEGAVRPSLVQRFAQVAQKFNDTV